MATTRSFSTAPSRRPRPLPRRTGPPPAACRRPGRGGRRPRTSCRRAPPGCPLPRTPCPRPAGAAADDRLPGARTRGPAASAPGARRARSPARAAPPAAATGGADADPLVASTPCSAPPRSTGGRLDLTYLEFELLAHLVAHPHRVHTRDQLVTTVWGYGHVGDGRTVDVHVARLRRKLGAEHRQVIQTVRRVGYKYAPPARPLTGGDRAARPAPRPSGTPLPVLLSSRNRSAGRGGAGRASPGMRLLVLGGTEFVGRAVVEAAVGRGWEVTVFHRGRHEAPPGCGPVLGDRTADGGRPRSRRARAGGTSSSTPGRRRPARSGTPPGCWPGGRAATCTCRAVRVRVGAAARATPRTPRSSTARRPTRRQTDYARDKRGGELAGGRRVRRGPLAAGAVRADPRPVREHRPAAVVAGPDRARAARSSRPARANCPLQYIDVRDLAEWILDAAEAGLSGAVHLVSPLRAHHDGGAARRVRRGHRG